jgi:hypothetical protein
MRGHTDITVFVPKWRKEASRPDNRRIIGKWKSFKLFKKSVR